MSLMEDSEDVIRAEEALRTLVAELKGQQEENELVHGIRGDITSSVYIPKDPSYFMKERKLNLRRLLNFPNQKKSKIMSEVINSDLESCDKTEYTDKSLPLLINEYFEKRIKKLVIMKHSLMLRWKRYCITPESQNSIQKEYKDRLKTIDNDFAILLSKIHRLQVVKESYICKSDQGIDEITPDDLLMYLEDLGIHLFSMRYMSQIISILQWVSIKFRKKRKERKPLDTHSSGKSEKSMKLDDKSESSIKSDHSKVLSAKASEKVYSIISTSEVFASYGGGVAIDEKNLNMPLHTNNIHYFHHVLLSLCKMYTIDMSIKNVKTSADEMELFSHVSRKFKTIFTTQEQMRLFKVYDKSDGGSDRWGIDSSHHALLKPASWMRFNPFKFKINLAVSKYINQMRSDKIVDEFLRVSAMFIKKSNCEDTQNSLRHHALIIQHLPVVHNTWVVSNPNGYTIADIFKTIYNKTDISMNTFSSEDDNPEPNNKEKDSYQFTETLQMLGLDDCVETKDDPSSVQGAYLSYLHLRFLKIRDLQRTCLSILNYFRSIERTLVINAHGFSKAELPKSTRMSSDGLDQEFYNQNLGDHEYLFDNIDQFKISDCDFMKFSGVVNHDDFYFHEDGRIHVKDRQNYWIMYDIAVKDFEELEEELILIGSYYITMDKDYRQTSLFNRKRSQSDSDINASFITEYGHREVDRYGVLYDLWNQQTEFMQNKKILVDVYMEVYNSITNRQDRMNISQIVTNIFYQKPRLDLTRSYFISSYRLESQILNIEFNIINKILNKEMERYRYFMLTECKSEENGYNLVEKLLIHVNTDESVLQPIYFLEFFPSLGMISQVKKALDFAIKNLKFQSDISGIQTELKKSLDFINFIDNEVLENELFSIKSFETDLFNSLFTPRILDNPNNLLKLGDMYIKNIDGRNTRGEKKTRKMKLLNEFGRLLNLLTVRFRLIYLLYESKYITTIYTNQATNLGYDYFHAYMRLVPFEDAKRNESAENQKPFLYISSVQDDDTIVDKYEPEESCLAIHELDTVHLGRFTLDEPLNVIELLISKGLEDLQLTLKMQFCHTSSLAVSIMLCDISRPSIWSLKDVDNFERSDTGTTQTNITYASPLSLASGPRPLALDKHRAKELACYDFYPEAFFSIQLEKTPIRDRMLNIFLKKFNSPIKLPSVELEKAKRDHVGYFINAFSDRISNTALKAQIISCYSSILAVLKLFPDIAHTFFQFGTDVSAESSPVNKGNYDFDPHILRDRCRKVISDDGKLLNIWYIPHFTEILYLHRENDDAKVNMVLLDFLYLIQYFRDIIHYVIGIWSLSFDDIRVSEELKNKVKKENEIPQETNCFNIVHQLHFDQRYPINVYTDYERSNRFQLEKEFQDLETQIQSLKDPTNMKEVIDLLNARKNYHYFYFDAFVTSVLSDTLLASNNLDVYNKLRQGIDSTKILISNETYATYTYLYLNVPSPIIINGKASMKLFPWRSLLDAEGPFIISCDNWIDIAENIQLCFAAIPNSDRHLLKDQFYSFNILMEEIILERGIISKPKKNDTSPFATDFFLLSTKFRRAEKKEIVGLTDSLHKESEDEVQLNISYEHVSILKNPIEAYTILVNYFLALKKFDILKEIYCSKKLKMTMCLKSEQYAANSKLFRKEILFPQLRKISEELSIPYMYYFGPSSDNDMIVYPQGVSITYINEKLTQCLIEEIEKINISEIQWRIIRELDRVIKKRNYEGKETDSTYYSVLKKTYLKPNLSADVAKRIEAPLLDSIEEQQMYGIIKRYSKEVKVEDEIEIKEIEINEIEVKEMEINEMEIKEEVEMKEENKIVEQKPKVQIVTLKKKYLNNCLQFLGNSILRIQKETFESYAMYFENILKQQQYLLRQKDKIIKDLRNQLQSKEESIAVQRQFILAECVVDLILEINFLRGQMREKQKIDNEHNSTLRKNMTLEFRSAVRNMYALTFEQAVQMKISTEKFRSNVIQTINDTRVEAFYDMIKVKEKSGAKITVDDDLMARNISICQSLNRSRQANLNISMITSRMKSLYNWSYMYTFNINDHNINLFNEEARKRRNVVLVTKEIAEQKVKLIKCEIKRLKETLVLSENDLSSLRATLKSEINQKSSKSKKEELNAIRVKQGINHKRIQINNMLELIKTTNAKMATMQNQFDEYLANKETVAIKSHKKVGKLKKLLWKERELKEEAFMKVDDLISQVYEFEAAFAVTKDEVKVKVKQESTIESLSKPRNPTTKPGHPTINFDYSAPEKAAPRLTYKTVLNQHCLPYTSCHYLPFRRNRLSLHNIRVELKSQYQTPKNVNNDSNVLSLPKPF